MNILVALGALSISSATLSILLEAFSRACFLISCNVLLRSFLREDIFSLLSQLLMSSRRFFCFLDSSSILGHEAIFLCEVFSGMCVAAAVCIAYVMFFL